MATGATPRHGYQRFWEALGAENYYRGVSAAASVRRQILAQRARRQAAALAASEHEGARRLADLLQQLAADRLDARESTQLATVEAGRRRILRSKEIVPWTGGSEVPIAWICARASQPPAGARVLFQAFRAWRPRLALELGTCVGVSGGYLASAQLLHGGGRLLSLEGNAALAEQARRLWSDAGLSDAHVTVGRFKATLPTVLTEGPFESAFIDGHHDGDATRRYVQEVAKVASPGALFVLDDIDYSIGMHAAWQDVCHHPAVVASADLGKMGIVVLR